MKGFCKSKLVDEAADVVIGMVAVVGVVSVVGVVGVGGVVGLVGATSMSKGNRPFEGLL